MSEQTLIDHLKQLGDWASDITIATDLGLNLFPLRRLLNQLKDQGVVEQDGYKWKLSNCSTSAQESVQGSPSPRSDSAGSSCVDSAKSIAGVGTSSQNATQEYTSTQTCDRSQSDPSNRQPK